MCSMNMTEKEKELFMEIKRLCDGIKVAVENIYHDGLDMVKDGRTLLYHLEKLERGGIPVPEEVL